jgi:subtilisin family serine protease
MRRLLVFLIALLALFATALPLGAATPAQEGGELDRNLVQVERPYLDGEYFLAPGPRSQSLAGAGGVVNVVIELGDAPTTEVFAAAKARVSVAQATVEAQQQLRHIQAAQQTLLASLQQLASNAQVIYRTQRVFNGIAVQVDADKLAQIQVLPGVKAIHPLVPKQLLNATSVPLIGADRLWAETGLAITGKNIKIGIIDSGIDYIHTDFGGNGSEEAYDENNPKVIDDSPFFPSAKVVGGYDFVGDDYDAANPRKSKPNPDPDPFDCAGHGTHVAGTAGGFGVNAEGSTYKGPYGPDTPFATLRIGPGVAPEALLYALKVFGCPAGQAGSTDVTDVAIEWAVDPNGDGDFSDRLDVINMSLGNDYGSDFDTTAIASDNAAAIGVIVVAAAGNSGNTYYITGSPATADRAISVAWSVDSTDVLDGFRVNSPPTIAGVKPSSNAINYDFANQPPVTGGLAYPPGQRSGCETFDATNAAAINEKIALLDWTIIDGVHECGSATRVNNAADAGAIGVVLVYPKSFIDILIAGSDRIPSTITPQEIGNELKANLDVGVNVTLTHEYANSQKVVIEARTDTLAANSSRGARRGDSMVKPDIAAPGQTIFSAAGGTGAQGESLSGTSMAAPHVAGAMALLRQIHPDWSVEELKALVMNTANNDLRADLPADSPIYGPGRVGAGRITLTDASISPVVAYNMEPKSRGVVSVSFGALEVVGTATATKTIRVLNKSAQTQSYTVTYRGLVDVPGISYSLSPSSVTLQPYGFVDIIVTMTANAEQMKHTHDETVEETQGAFPRHWLSEEAGHVILTSTGGNPPLRVPVYAAPRPASAMRAKTKVISSDDAPTSTRNIELVGQGVSTGENFPIDEVSIVTASELQHSSPNNAWSQGIVNNADLKYVGVASDFGVTGAISETQLTFGIATQDNWSSPNEVQFNVFIDTNRDSNPDFQLLNANVGLATGGTATDTFIAVLVNLKTGELIPQDFMNGLPAAPFEGELGLNTVPFNTNVMMLPVYARDLGLTDANTTFDYRVISTSRDYETEDEDQIVYELMAVDSTPFLTYNAAAPGVSFLEGIENLPMYFDLNGESIPVTYNRDAFEANDSQGILLLHHYNATPNRRAEVVTIRGNSSQE